MEERRRFSRLDLEVKVAWDKIYDEVEPITPNNIATCKNISSDGIGLFIYNEDIVAGDRLSLQLTLLSGETVKIVGAVVWAKEGKSKDGNDFDGVDVGIKFLKITNEDKEIISKLVAFAT